MAKYYAVQKGVQPGVYMTWEECEAQVKGYPGAKYKKFPTLEEAEAFAMPDSAKGPKEDTHLIPANTNTAPELSPTTLISAETVQVYIDGSYNPETDEYGYGVWIDDGKRQKIFCGRGATQEGGRNIEGEVAAAKTALAYIASHCEKNLEIKINYDYSGLENWADGHWKAHTTYSNAYARLVNALRDLGMDIRFRHITGHSGNPGNELVDKLAKVGCGMPLKQSEKVSLMRYEKVPGFPENLQMPPMDAVQGYTMSEDYDFLSELHERQEEQERE